MTKFLAIVKREYLKRVRTKSFIVATLLGPLLMLAFIFVPVLFALLGSNEPVRIAVVDQSGRMYERVREAIMRESDEGGAKSVGGQFDLSQNPQVRARQAGSTFRRLHSRASCLVRALNRRFEKGIECARSV